MVYKPTEKYPGKYCHQCEYYNKECTPEQRRELIDRYGEISCANF